MMRASSLPPPTGSSSTTSLARYFFVLAAAAFAMSTIAGLAGAVASALPRSLPALDLAVLRPLHVFLAIAATLAGLQGIVLALIGGRARGFAELLQLAAMAGFVVAGAAAQVLKLGSGREYVSWPLPLTALLLLSVLIMAWRLYARAGAMERRSPEAFWLVGLGALLIVSGLVESELWRLEAVAANYIRNLSLQWHGIDTLFAGLNIALYGCAAFLMSDSPKPLRAPFLFAIAGFGLLFTFGHHHYVSPQPYFLKSLAFVASMIAILSFWRHAAAFRKLHAARSGDRHLLALWRSVELWTLVSLASGILFAVPQFNLIVHGTYFIVAHAMGSMIGVNLLIVVAGGLARAHRGWLINIPRTVFGVGLVNLGLALVWAVLGAAGLAKGVIRVSGGYDDYQPIVDRLLYGFPLAGAVLAAGIAILCAEVIRANLKALAARRPARQAAEMT
jgi:uncharacterized membrane protein